MNVDFVKWALANGYTPDSLSDRETLRQAKDAYAAKDRTRRNKAKPVTAVLLDSSGEVAALFPNCGGTRAARTAAEAWIVANDMANVREYQVVISEPKPVFSEED